MFYTDDHSNDESAAGHETAFNPPKRRGRRRRDHTGNCGPGANAPTKRKMSWALHFAWAAVKSGISRTGVPTKRTRSRHRSKIQGEDLLCAGEETGARDEGFAGNFANGIAWVAIAVS